MLILLLVERNTTAIFISYLLLLFSIIYSMSLIFFIFERNVNFEVQHYRDALWWAGMTVTTVGSNIIPYTNVGKIITDVGGNRYDCFSIFTVYFTSVVNRLSKSEKE